MVNAKKLPRHTGTARFVSWFHGPRAMSCGTNEHHPLYRGSLREFKGWLRAASTMLATSS